MSADKFSSIPSEVFANVAYQLPTLVVEKAFVVTQSPLDNKSLDGLRNAFQTTKVEIGDLSSLNCAETTSQDVVFLNRIAAKQSDDELRNTAKQVIRALKNGGVAVAYEDFAAVSHTQVAHLSTFYDSVQESVDGVETSFKLLSMNQTSEETDSGLYFILQKLSSSDLDNELMFRSFLDHTQYLAENIEAYEWIFGKGFISPGGVNMNRRVFAEFDDLDEGKTMLDIGSGLAGGVRQAAKELGLKVTACDISANMMAMAVLRHRQNPVDGVTYMLADVMRYRFEPESFDYAYTRDCIHHIDDLGALLRKVRGVLKPGGQFIITMYARGYGPFSDAFKQFVSSRRYYLKTLEEMVDLAKGAGFSDVEGENLTPTFKKILHKELKHALDFKDDFLKLFDQKHYDGLVDGWKQKLEFIKDDNHNWIKLKCTK